MAWLLSIGDRYAASGTRTTQTIDRTPLRGYYNHSTTSTSTWLGSTNFVGGPLSVRRLFCFGTLGLFPITGANSISVIIDRNFCKKLTVPHPRRHSAAYLM